MSLLSLLGIAPAADAWYVPVRGPLGIGHQDVLFFDEQQARRHDRARPLVVADEDDEEEEQAGPFGGFGQTHTLGWTAWASGFGARG